MSSFKSFSVSDVCNVLWKSVPLVWTSQGESSFTENSSCPGMSNSSYLQLLEAYSVQVMLTEDGQCHECIAGINQSQRRTSSDITLN